MKSIGSFNLSEIKTSILFFILSLGMQSAIAQTEFKVEGTLQSKTASEGVPFATVTLHRLSDSSLISGTITNAAGIFQLSINKPENCLLEISHLGFEPESVEIIFNEKRKINTGIIFLNEKTLEMESLTVIGERLKAKSEGNKTTYFMNMKMEDASFSGTDVLKHIPGVQADFMQNISLEGSSNFILMVDGIERDLDFLRQLDAKKIDKIEVTNTPGSKYDADVNGVINIILKEKETGISVHAYIEVPTSAETMYLFPTYSLNYGREKFNFYTSYNGGISNFDLVNAETLDILASGGNTTITVLEDVRQKNWSHKFHFGMDFAPGKNNQFNLYGFLNPYSWEQDGKATMDVHPENESDKNWAATKNDHDKNLQSFGSLYFKHIFQNKQEIIADLSHYNLKADNSILFQADSSINIFPKQIENTSQPSENRAILRVDYSLPFSENWKINTGIKSTHFILKDKENKNFRFSKNIWSAYGELLFSKSKFDATLGLRVEKSDSKLENEFQNDAFALLPHFLLNWKINSDIQLKLIYRKSLNRPGLYELNPTEYRGHPLKVTMGNPVLDQEISNYLAADFSSAFRGNFITARVFGQQFGNFIQPFSFINKQGVFVTKTQNLGNVFQYGIQLKGSLKLHKMITANPYLKVFNIHGKANGSIADADSENIALESGLSALFAFKNNWSASVQVQYNQGLKYFQNETYNDALYFVSIEKSINDKLKIGLTSAVPFKKSVTYHANYISGQNFRSHWEGNIKTNGFPLWLKLSYQFNSGKKVNIIQREKEQIKAIPKKGF
jgi:hypothetical protein